MPGNMTHNKWEGCIENKVQFCFLGTKTHGRTVEYVECASTAFTVQKQRIFKQNLHYIFSCITGIKTNMPQNI